LNNELDLLFARLEWPSGLVRERACVVIAELLCNPSESEKTFQFLKNWIETQRLESIAIYGLLILFKARSINPAIRFPEDITSNIFKPSMLSNLLLHELNMQPLEINRLFYVLDKEDVPKSHERFFFRNLRIFPGFHVAERINQRGIKFTKHWLHEWSNIVSALNTVLSRDSFNYWGREDSEHYSAFDVLISDIYRSAFLRSLAWAVDQQGFNIQEANLLAIRNCPVDLGLWNINPGRKPEGWPFVERIEGEIDTTPSKIWSQVNEIWSNQKSSKNNLIHANGIVHTSDKVVYYLEIKGAFQYCIGNKAPNIEDIIYQYDRGFKFGPKKLKFSGKMVNADFEEIQSGDWIIIPLVQNIWPTTMPRWQFWRVNNIYLPNGAFFEEPLEYECTDKSIQILSQGNIIGEWKDWTHGFAEKTFANLPSNTGSGLYLDNEVINSLCEEMNMSFCWFCKISCFSREYSYEKYQISHFYGHFGGTTLIIP
jgi:hypothetical protein